MKAKPKCRVVDLAGAIGKSKTAASLILAGKRPPQLEDVIAAFQELGVRLPPIRRASAAEIAVLARYARGGFR